MGAALEARGIATVSVAMLDEVVGKVRPPRALLVPYGLGYPLGRPHDAALQRVVLRAMLSLATRTDVPVVESFVPPRESSSDPR